MLFRNIAFDTSLGSRTGAGISWLVIPLRLPLQGLPRGGVLDIRHECVSFSNSQKHSSITKVEMSSRALRKAQREREPPAVHEIHELESGDDKEEEEEEEQTHSTSAFVQKSAFALLGEVHDSDTEDVVGEEIRSSLKENVKYLRPAVLLRNRLLIWNLTHFKVKMTTISATLKRRHSNRVRRPWPREGRRRNRERRVPRATKRQQRVKLTMPLILNSMRSMPLWRLYRSQGQRPAQGHRPRTRTKTSWTSANYSQSIFRNYKLATR